MNETSGSPVERVARAMWASNPGCSPEGLPDVHRDAYLRIAAAAIDAMQPDINQQLKKAWSAGFTEGMTKR